jgi:hypothetical protein
MPGTGQQILHGLIAAWLGSSIITALLRHINVTPGPYRGAGGARGGGGRLLRWLQTAEVDGHWTQSSFDWVIIIAFAVICDFVGHQCRRHYIYDKLFKIGYSSQGKWTSRRTSFENFLHPPLLPLVACCFWPSDLLLPSQAAGSPQRNTLIPDCTLCWWLRQRG